jgi:hypothetical protein
MDVWKFDEEEGLQLSKSEAEALSLCMVPPSLKKLRRINKVTKMGAGGKKCG